MSQAVDPLGLSLGTTLGGIARERHGGGPSERDCVARAEVNKWLVAVSIAFGSLMATIDSSIVNVALPNIRGELGASIQEITWISTAYMIAMVLVMPLTGFLGGFFGQKRVYLDRRWSLFVAGSALCGTARSLPTLVALAHPPGPRRRRAAADAAGDPAPDVPARRAGHGDGDVLDGRS